MVAGKEPRLLLPDAVVHEFLIWWVGPRPRLLKVLTPVSRNFFIDLVSPSDILLCLSYLLFLPQF